MQNRTRIGGFFAAVALMSSLAGAQALEPMAPKPPRSSASVVGRAVYIGTLQELNSFLFPSNVFDDQIVYQAIKWASGKAIGPYSVLVLDSQESLTGGLWAAWPNFMARHPEFNDLLA